MPKVVTVRAQKAKEGSKNPWRIWIRADDGVSYGVSAKTEDRWKQGDEFIIKTVYKEGESEQGPWKTCSVGNKMMDEQQSFPEAAAVPEAQRVSVSEYRGAVIQEKLACFVATKVAGIAHGLSEDEAMAFALHTAGPTGTSVTMGLEKGRINPDLPDDQPKDDPQDDDKPPF